MTEKNQVDEVEQRILNATKELFLHYGFDKTTMTDIARQSGVSKSTIYLRWNKKEDLFDSLIWRESREYTEDWIQRIEDDPNGGTYGAWMRHALGAFFDNEFLRVLYKQDRRMIGTMLARHGIEDMFTRRMKMFMSFFKQMQDANVVRKDIDAKTLSYLMNSLQYGFIHMADIIPAEYTPEMDNTLAMMTDMLEKYIQPKDGGDSDAGKVILRQFMTQIRSMLDTIEKP